MLASGNGYIVNSFSHDFGQNGALGMDELEAIDPATGAILGAVSRGWTSGMAGTGPIAVDEAGNFYAYLLNQLWSYRPNGDLRFILPPGPRASLAVGGGIIVESDTSLGDGQRGSRGPPTARKSSPPG